MADEVTAAPVTGQVAPAPAEGAGQAAPFFTSGEDVFNTRDDLEKAWKDSYTRREDYTRKSQANAQLRRALEQRERQFGEREKAHDTKVKEYEQYDNFLKRRPDAYAQMQRLLNGPPSPDAQYQRAESLVNDKTSDIEARLEEFENWKKQQEIDREKTDVFGRLESEFTDFDRADIETRFNALAEGNLEALARTLYHARRGEQSPLEMEQKITDQIKKKGGVKTASPKGSPKSADGKFSSIEAARNQALIDTQGE